MGGQRTPITHDTLFSIDVLPKVEELRAEVEAASKSVRQLGSLLFEMEVQPGS